MSMGANHTNRPAGASAMLLSRRCQGAVQSQVGLHHDQRGQVTLEWALILAAIAIPLLVVFGMCLEILVGNYRMVTFLNSMPFP